MNSTFNLETLVLASGAHDSFEEGACLLEVVSYMAGEPWSDSPACASPVCAAFGRSWNDGMNDEDRQSLKQYVPRLLNSKGTNEQENQRGWMSFDWLVRVQLPTWMDLTESLQPIAKQLRELPEVTEATIESAISTIEAAQAASSAARSAAWDAASSAARSAAWDAASSAASSAAWDAAWDAASSAARSAASSAACSAASSAAWNAASSAAWNAAWNAASSAASSAARSAASSAARSALAPTVATLQISAHDLFDRMLKVTGN